MRTEGKMKKIAVVSGIAAVCLILLIILWGCLQAPFSESIGDILRKKGGSEERGITAAGGTISGRPTVHENGIFYIDGSLLCFYDYESEESYIFCSETDCEHTTPECSAYVGDQAVRAGFSMHGDRVYLLCGDRNFSEVKFISMDLSGKDRKTIAVFDSDHLDGCMISNIGDVLYAGGYAYLNFYLLKNEQGEPMNGQQLAAVRLEDGKITNLTEVFYGEETLSYELVSEKDVIYSVVTYDPPLPTYREYLEEHPGTEEGDYFDAVHGGTPGRKISYYDFSPESGEIQLKHEEAMEVYEDFLGYKERFPKETFFGEVNGKWFLSSKNTSKLYGKSTYFFWDPQTEEKEVLVEVKNGEGYFGTGSYADASNVMYNDEELLWVEEVQGSNTKHDLYLYNIETKEKRMLYEIDSEKREYSPDLRGVTSEYVVTAERNAFNQLVYCVTDKEDFEKTCLENARRTPVVIR